MSDDDLEEAFRAACHRHGDLLSDHYADMVELSERTGIPVGRYVPRSFREKWAGVSHDVVTECAPVSEGFEDDDED